MKMKAFKKWMAMCLCFIMVASIAVPTALAAGEPVYPNYEDAKVGDLLYKADFSGKDGIYKPEILQCKNADPSLIKASEDGNALTVAGYSFVGGPVKGLPLNNESVYTIYYSAIRDVAGNLGFYVDQLDGIGGNGFYTRASSQTTLGYAVKGAYALTDREVNYVDGGQKARPYRSPEGLQKFKVTVDGKSGTLSIAVLMNPNANVELPKDKIVDRWAQIYTIKLSEYGQTFNGKELNLIFNTYLAEGDTPVPATFSDVRIYKGIPDLITVDKPGEVILEMGDITKDAVGKYGVKYTYDAKERHNTRKSSVSYEYDILTKTNVLKSVPEGGEANTTVAIGGSTNLLLGHGQKYTITYEAKQAVGGCGVRHAFGDYQSSQGFYATSNTQACFAKGTQTVGGHVIHPYVKYTEDMLIDGSIYGAPDGFAKFVVEIDDYVVTAYVNGVMLFKQNTLKNNTANTLGHISDNLDLVIQAYVNDLSGPAGTDVVTIRDIKVYSGLIMKNDIAVNDGEKTEIVSLANGEKFNLPKLSRAGKILVGWRIDGAEKLTPAGTDVLADGVKKIDAVWENVMGKSYVQFKDNGNGTQDMRIVGILDTLDYKDIGYKIVIKYTENGAEKTITEEKFALKFVYKSLTAKYGKEVVTAKCLGYGEECYLTSFVITNLPTNIGKITVELTPYQTAADKSAPTFADAAQTIVLDNGVLA